MTDERGSRKTKQTPKILNFGKITHLCFMCLVIQYKEYIYWELFTVAYCLETLLVRHSEEGETTLKLHTFFFLNSFFFPSGCSHYKKKTKT